MEHVTRMSASHSDADDEAMAKMIEDFYDVQHDSPTNESKVEEEKEEEETMFPNIDILKPLGNMVLGIGTKGKEYSSNELNWDSQHFNIDSYNDAKIKPKTFEY